MAPGITISSQLLPLFVNEEIPVTGTLSGTDINSLTPGPLGTDYTILWSNGSNTPFITVSPNVTTTYYCTFSNNMHSCTDSVTVTVLPPCNPTVFYQDTIAACGINVDLDAGAGYSSYLWSTASTEQTISADETGWYSCTVSNLGCSATDSVFVSIINALIQPNDTIVNVNQPVTLAVVRSNNIPDEGLIAFYPYNGDALDASGNGHHGTIVNAIPDYDRFGISNKAFRYDGYTGTERYISSNLGMYDTLSFSVWFKAGYPSTHYPSIFQYGVENRLQFGMLGNHPAYIQNGNIGKVQGGAVIGGSWVSYIENNVKSDDNNWHHLVANFIPHDSIYLYIDNLLVGSDYYQPNYPSNDLFYIGRTIYDNPGGSPHGGHFDGTIDDVRIYNRPLSKLEIANLFFENSSLDTNYTYLWSTGATTSSITVTPTQTTTYYCTISNGIHSCTDSVTVTVLLPPEPTCPEDIEVCANASLFELTGASPAGGTYSGNGVLFGAYFDPATAGLGEHVITYTVTGQGYTSSCSFTITVIPPPEVVCPETLTVCINAGIIVLDQGAPEGGLYEGPGAFLDLFNPLDAGLGDHLITYYYTAPDGCTGSCTFTLTVTDVPEAICPADFSVCITDPAFTLTGAQPEGGNYRINGIVGNMFDPAALGFGTHLVEYLYSIASGCQDVCEFHITVVPEPEVTILADPYLLCEDYQNQQPLPYPLTANVPGYTSLNWSTSGDGTFSNPGSLNTTYSFGPNDLSGGQVTFTLTVQTSGVCTGTVSDQLTVFLPSQLIEIPAGWSGISSNVIPHVPNIGVVTAPCLDQLIIQISIGGIYWPDQNVNTLGVWNANAGYKVKYLAPCCLPLYGQAVPLPSTVHLNVGVNYLPVHTKVPVKLTEVFGADTNRIISVVDIGTLQIYSPSFGGLNTLVWLEPGVGYLAYMQQSANITYPANLKSSAPAMLPKREPFRGDHSAPWNEVTNTGLYHLIVFEKMALQNIEPGDVIGVFNQHGLCAGFGIKSETDRLLIPVFGDDPYTAASDGMEEQEVLLFRLYRHQSGEVANVKVNFDPSAHDSDGLFAAFGLSKVVGMKVESTSIMDQTAEQLSVYPNPADKTVTVQWMKGIRSVSLVNAFSQTLSDIQLQGEQHVEIDISIYPAGVYILTVKDTAGEVFLRRLVVE